MKTMKVNKRETVRWTYLFWVPDLSWPCMAGVDVPLEAGDSSTSILRRYFLSEAQCAALQ
jgi:hypothetical protein